MCYKRHLFGISINYRSCMLALHKVKEAVAMRPYVYVTPGGVLCVLAV